MDTLVIYKDKAMETWERMRCNGHCINGYWKGSPCRTNPTLRSVWGQLWCRSHAPINEQMEFVKVINT